MQLFGQGSGCCECHVSGNTEGGYFGEYIIYDFVFRLGYVYLNDLPAVRAFTIQLMFPLNSFWISDKGIFVEEIYNPSIQVMTTCKSFTNELLHSR